MFQLWDSGSSITTRNFSDSQYTMYFIATPSAAERTVSSLAPRHSTERTSCRLAVKGMPCTKELVVEPDLYRYKIQGSVF